MSKHNIFTRIVAVISILALNFMFVPITNAAAMTGISDIMSRQTAAVASNHTIKFTTPTGVAAGQAMTVTFPAGFVLTGVVFGDVDISFGTTTGLETNDVAATAVAATASGATWGAAVSGQVLTITSGTTAIPAGNVVIIEIGTNATYGGTGTHQITNPSVGTYVVTLGGTIADSGSFAVPIVTNDQVTLSATVATSMTFTLSGNTSAFGALSTGSVTPGGTDITITAATNTNAGYTISVRDQGDGTTGGLYNAGATSNINSVTALLSGGTEGYGIQASTSTGASLAATYNKSGNNVGGLTVAAQTLASRAAANTANDSIVIHHLAAISGFTKAGTYNDTITYVAAGNY
jgi:hypothetical protein